MTGEKAVIESYLNFLGESSREHECLPLSRLRHVVLFHNATDLGFEAHIQHTVCFIKYYVPAHKQSTCINKGSSSESCAQISTCKSRLNLLVQSFPPFT